MTTCYLWLLHVKVLIVYRSMTTCSHWSLRVIVLIVDRSMTTLCLISNSAHLELFISLEKIRPLDHYIMVYYSYTSNFTPIPTTTTTTTNKVTVSAWKVKMMKLQNSLFIFTAKNAIDMIPMKFLYGNFIELPVDIHLKDLKKLSKGKDDGRQQITWITHLIQQQTLWCILIE